MCTVLLPPGVNPIAVKKVYIISRNIIYISLAPVFSLRKYLEAPASDAGLRRRSVAARQLIIGVRIPPGACCVSCVR